MGVPAPPPPGSSSMSTATGSIIWSTDIGSSIRLSSPAVVDGIVYIGSNNGSVHALDAASGLMLWSTSPTEDAIWPSPAVADGLVLVGSLDHYMYGLEVSSGELVWRTELDYRIHASPSVANGVAYIATDEGETPDPDARYGFKAYALNASSGEVLWSTTECQDPSGVGTDSNVVIANGTVLVQNEQGYLCAFQLPTAN